MEAREGGVGEPPSTLSGAQGLLLTIQLLPLFARGPGNSQRLISGLTVESGEPGRMGTGRN